MFEFHQFRSTGRSPVVPAQACPPAAPVTRLAVMVWGEHCTECAAPACFATCDLYRPRPDGRCRRFEEGLRPNHACGGFRGCGAELVFRKWAKLEARGNTALEPVAVALARERWAGRIAPWLNRLGALLAALRAGDRWRHLAFSLLERWNRRLHHHNPHPDLKPDGFLLELYNPGPSPLALFLTMGIARSSLEPQQRQHPLPPPLTLPVTASPGHVRYFFERRLFQDISDCGLPFDITLLPQAGQEAHLVVLGADFVTLASPIAAGFAEPVKCLVWDLDNTLWDGTLLEGEPQHLRPGVLALLEHLDRRGVLHSIASKNSHEAAWPVLERLGVADYFLAPQIHWGPKSGSLTAIARRLDIGLNSLAFIDDSPFERAEVAQAHPQVTIRSATDVDELRHDPLFQGNATPEAARRRRFYQEALQREEVQRQFGADQRGFLATCGLELALWPLGPADLERVAELTQRTNQLNFSGRRYARADLAPLLADPALEQWVLACRDKFGSYGTVGFGLVRRDNREVRVEEFMLSCRVQGRFIEQAFFHALAAAQPPGPMRLRVVFQATSRNQPARQTLETLAFTAADDGDRNSLIRDLPDAAELDCAFIQVRPEPFAE
ncbi:MAG: HAD-IIIC family phosphatase [Magnetococcales bacterium]|nr:HAD-IIIC family phosphatase [Magnetococcales bacterium]